MLIMQWGKVVKTFIITLPCQTALLFHPKAVMVSTDIKSCFARILEVVMFNKCINITVNPCVLNCDNWDGIVVSPRLQREEKIEQSRDQYNIHDACLVRKYLFIYFFMFLTSGYNRISRRRQFRWYLK